MNDFINIRVKDDDLDFDINKDINSFTDVKIDETSITIKVEFADPSAISSELLDPDSLIIVFIKPELIVDSETGEPLTKDENQF